MNTITTRHKVSVWFSFSGIGNYAISQTHKRIEILDMYSQTFVMRFTPNFSRRGFFGNAAGLSLILAVAGCSTAPSADYSKLGLVNVSGTITLDGVPLDAAVVTFEDLQTSQFSYGQTNSSGNYSLQLDSVQSGVVPGQKVVRISTTRKILGLNAGEEGSSEEEADEVEPDGKGATVKERKSELVPDKYNKKSELTVDVSSANTTFDFDLQF